MEHQEKPRAKRVITCVLLLLLAGYAILPPRRVDLLRFIPDDSLAVGFHRDLRATWKRQIRHPAIASLLAGYGAEPRDAIKCPGAFWTFLLAVGEDVATAVLIEEAGPHARPVLAAASPAGRRRLLLTAFWHLRWVPGLGRIETDDQGRRFIRLDDGDDGDGESGAPQFLSVAFGEGVLRVKFSETPEFMDDMGGQSRRADEFSDLLSPGTQGGASHRFQLVPDNIEAHFPPGCGGGAGLDMSFDANSLVATVLLPGAAAPDAAHGATASLFAHTLTGVNATAQALAGGHAFAFLLAPSAPAAELAADFFGCAASPAQGEDAAFYLTGPPFGGNFLLFPIPALTASIPGLRLDQAKLRSALAPLPKQLRAPFALHGESTVCSSAASLRGQRGAAPPAGPTWENGFAKFRDARPSFFLHIDCDPFFSQLLQVAGAIPVAASFSRDSFDPLTLEIANAIQSAIPRLPTGLVFDSAACLSNADIRVTGFLSR